MAESMKGRSERSASTPATEDGAREGQPLRVLLISPLHGLDPPSGDVTYTEQLLGSSLPGLHFTTYAEALQGGQLVEVGTRAHVASVTGWRRVPALGAALWRKLEYTVRRSGMAYREPLRIFRVRPSTFDLVHVHVFHTRFIGTHPPVVMSGGGPMRWLYEGAFGWPIWRLRLADVVDRLVATVWRATFCAVRPGSIDRFIAPSEDLRSWMTERGWPPELIEVIPNFLALAPHPLRSARNPRTLGFVAKDFEAKGGPLVLLAYDQLRRSHPELDLVIVGSPPRYSDAWLEDRGITWHPHLERSRLLECVLPEIDILVYPSNIDTGVPFSALEPLALGVPAVVSNYRGLPDLVRGGAGLVTRRETAALAKAVEQLLDPAEWLAASRAASERFMTVYSAGVQMPRLARLYRELVPVGRVDID